MAEATWKTDDQLHGIGYALGRKIMQMYDEAGIQIYVPIYPGGAPSPDANETFAQSVAHDAEDYLSLDPEKITDAYFTLQGMATATGSKESEARQNIGLANSWLAANWNGEAARAFARQMGYIEGFLDRQEDYYLYAVQALGIAFSLSVQFRESFYNLAESTIDACNQVIAKEIKEDTAAEISLGFEIVQAGIDLVTMQKVKDLAKWGIGKILEGTKKATTEPLDTSGAPTVVDSYTRARDKLRGSYEAGLTELRNWLNRQESELNGSNVGILEPLPVECDIDGPNFSYGEFFNENHDPDIFGPKVQQEHQKHLQQKQQQQPPGVIGRRLNGDSE